MDVPGKREKLFLFYHLDALHPGRPGRLLQVQTAVDRHYEDKMDAAVASASDSSVGFGHQCLEATIKAFCWMQGEGDSYPGYHSVYAENLATFVGNVRTELSEFTGGKELPFIDAKINPDREVWEYGPEVNAQKEQFAALSENNYLIDTVAEGLHTDQEPMVPDKCHYDTESEVKLGNLFAEAFEPFLEPVTCFPN